jgi:Tfp pilus assembly protein PilN
MKKSFFNINIYKPETKMKKTRKRPSDEGYRDFLLIVLFLLFLVICSTLFLRLYIPQKRMIEDAHTEEGTLNHALQELKAEEKRLVAKKDLYLQIKAEAVSWAPKLVSLSRVLPEGIWLSKIEFPGRYGNFKGEQNFLISGWTFSGIMEENMDQIGDFLIGLNHSEEFKEDFEPFFLEFTKKLETSLGQIQFRMTGKSKDLSF